MAAISLLAVGAYRFPPVAGFAIPWQVIVLLGTTVSLVAGFKNGQVLARSGEALRLFSQIAAASRVWSGLSISFTDTATAHDLIYHHLAWLTALRFALRRPMAWETMARPANAEFRRRYHISEDSSSLRAELSRFLPDAEAGLQKRFPARWLLELQGRQVNLLLKNGTLGAEPYAELMNCVREMTELQAQCDRIKDTPYPRQYAIVGTVFVFIFCTLLPFGVTPMFADFGSAGRVLHENAIWLTVPFSAVLGWMYMSLDQVGESTSNPFEGGPNDVPITEICRDIEIDLRAALGETDLPHPLEPTNGFAT